jgi:hypothetical protein
MDTLTKMSKLKLEFEELLSRIDDWENALDDDQVLIGEDIDSRIDSLTYYL